MKKLKVSESFVREAYDAACDEWKEKIKKEFPDLFKSKFEVGKWYTIDDRIFYCTGINDVGELYGYGVFEGKWGDITANSPSYDIGMVACNSVAAEDRLREATREEVKEALIKEAKKRYSVGSKVHLIRNNIGGNFGNEVRHTEYAIHGLCQLYVDGNLLLFYNGKWATIIEDDKCDKVRKRIEELENELKQLKKQVE